MDAVRAMTVRGVATSAFQGRMESYFMEELIFHRVSLIGRFPSRSLIEKAYVKTAPA